MLAAAYVIYVLLHHGNAALQRDSFANAKHSIMQHLNVARNSLEVNAYHNVHK